MKKHLHIRYLSVILISSLAFYLASDNLVDVFNKIDENLKYNSVILNKIDCTFEVIEFADRSNHDCTFVGNKIWSFDKPSDGGWVVSVNTDGSDAKRIFRTSFYDENGLEIEMKSVDCAFGGLLVGNGSAISWKEKDKYEHCAYIFYDYLQWEKSANNASVPITFDNCGFYTKINLSELGAKVYAFYGGGEDIILVSCNLFNDIYEIELGKGMIDLGKGDYSPTSCDKYNGSYKILSHLHQAGAIGQFAAHGGQYYNGALYLASNDPSKCLVYRIKIRDNTSLKFEELNFNIYSDKLNYYGNIPVKLVYSYIDGLCIKDGKIYAQILNVNGIQSGSFVIVAEI